MKKCKMSKFFLTPFVEKIHIFRKMDALEAALRALLLEAEMDSANM